MDNKILVQKINDAFLENDIEKILVFFSDDIVWNMYPHIYKGKDEIRKSMQDGMGDYKLEAIIVNEIISEGDSAASNGLTQMRNTKTGNIAEGYYCDLYQFRDGLVVNMSSYVVSKK